MTRLERLERDKSSLTRQIESMAKKGQTKSVDFMNAVAKESEITLQIKHIKGEN